MRDVNLNCRMSAIRSEWLMLKYKPVVPAERCYLELLLKYNEKFPWKTVKKLKRTYSESEYHERLKVLW